MTDQVLPGITVTASRLPPERPPGPVRRPRCAVHIDAGAAEESQLPREMDLTPWVRRVRTTKALGSPVGSFEVGLTFQTVDELRASLSQLILPDNRVTIALDAGLPDSTLEMVMEGWVTHVSTRVAVGRQGQPMREVVIAGQDAGKFLVQHELPLFLLTLGIMGEDEAQFRELNGLMVSGAVGEVLRTLFLLTFDRLTIVPRVVRERVQLLTDPALDGNGGDALPAALPPQGIWARHGKWWNMFSEFADIPWNHVYGDWVPNPAEAPFGDAALAAPTGTTRSTRGPGYYLIVRPQPFSVLRWEALRTTTVFDSEILSAVLRVSDDERVNVVMVAPGGMGKTAGIPIDLIQFNAVAYSAESMRHHGTRPFPTPSFRYMAVGPGPTDAEEQERALAGSGDIMNALRERSRRLWDWYAINHQLWKGVWVIAGTPGIRIGERVQEQDTPSSAYRSAEAGPRRTFYVEHVVQDYLDGSHYRTHLGLTRGQPTGGFLSAPEPDARPSDTGIGSFVADGGARQ
jgi:hypothetical protein